MTISNERQCAAALAGNNGFSLISNEKLIELYTTMVRCRMIAERAKLRSEESIRNASQGGIGQEAAAVGVAINLLPEDSIFWPSSNFFGYIISDKSVDRILKHANACATCSDFAFRPDTPERLHMATGIALANKTNKNGKVAVIFNNGQDAAPDAWHQALHVAEVHQLPILFIRVNGLLTEQNRKQQNGRKKAIQCAIPCIPVDGNDVVAVYRVVTESIVHARKGNGATLIDCFVKRSKADDPIRKMETYLKSKGLFTKEMKLEVAGGFAHELDAVVGAIRSTTHSTRTRK